MEALSLCIPLPGLQGNPWILRDLGVALRYYGHLEAYESMFTANLLRSSVRDDPNTRHDEGFQKVTPQYYSYTTDSALFKATRIIQCKFENDCATWRMILGGTLSLYRRGTKSKPLPVVCKFILRRSGQQEFHKHLKREAELYENQLKPLQGAEVPIFYGMFSGALPRSDGGISQEQGSCILLEDCGRGFLEYTYENLMEHHVAIKQALHKLHEAGVHHGHLEDSGNILKVDSPGGDARIVIVDFAIARLHQHPCQGPTQLYENFGWETGEPGWCTELYLVYRMIRSIITPRR